jgi:anti-sigma B factor antagonist
MEIKTINDVKVVGMKATFDAYVAKDIESVLIKLVDEGARKIICDMSKTEYISSAGLSVFLAIAKRLQKLNGKIIICSLNPRVQEVFKMTGFIKIFQIYSSQEEALQALA